MDKEQEVTPEMLAACLMSFFKLLEADKNNNRFIVEIAKQTIEKYQAGQNVEITTKQIFLELFPNHSETTASSTLANLWKTLPNLQGEIANRLAEYARNNYSFNVYPWIEKIESVGGAGNLAKYKVIGIPINESQIAGPNPYRKTIVHDIEYIAVKDFEPSWIAKLFFGPTNAITGRKKWVMIFFPIIKMVSYLLLLLLFIIALNKQTLGTVSIIYIACMVATVWFFIYEKNRFERFTEDRIIIASELFMSWKELNVLQELVTIHDEKGNIIDKKVQLIKYVGVCPVCSAQVELAKGEPDFPRRIVGRCAESPREHVYSFDRVTKLGVMLHENSIKPLNHKIKK